MQMDKQTETDMRKVVVTFCNFVSVPNNDDDNNNNNNSNRVEGRCGHGAIGPCGLNYPESEPRVTYQ